MRDRLPLAVLRSSLKGIKMIRDVKLAKVAAVVKRADLNRWKEIVTDKGKKAWICSAVHIKSTRILNVR